MCTYSNVADSARSVSVKVPALSCMTVRNMLPGPWVNPVV